MISYAYDGEAIRVYVDGELDRNANYNPFQYGGGVYDGGSDFTVANRAIPRWQNYPDGPGDDSGFDGRLAGLAVYERALSAEEMRRLYERTLRPAAAETPR